MVVGALIIVGGIYWLNNRMAVRELPTEVPPITTGTSTVTLRGEYVCLPHRDTSGPQTLECALGLKADNGLYYALDTSRVASSSVIATNTGTRLVVEGVIVPIETISSDWWQKYAIRGIIQVNSWVTE